MSTEKNIAEPQEDEPGALEVVRHVVKMEVCTKFGDVLATVECEDGVVASIKVDCISNAREWPAIAEQIRLALLDMRLDGDAAS